MKTCPRWPLCLIVLWLFLPCSAAQAQLPPEAPNSAVITLTPQPGYFTEPGIAVNPNNPQQVVAVYQDNAHAAYSFDAGRTWQIATGVEPPNYRVSGDVSATYDNQGHAFICYIAFDKLGTYSYWGHNGGAQWDLRSPLPRWRQILGAERHRRHRAARQNARRK